MPDDVIHELSRRGVIKAGIGSLGLASISGGSLAQVAEVDETVLQDAAFLLGTGPKNPNDVPELAPDGPFISGNGWTKDRYAYIYQTSRGEQYQITQDMDQWRGLADLIVAAELDIQGPTTILGSGDAPTLIADSATLARAEKISMPETGVLRYDGDTTVYGRRVHAVGSFSGANAEFGLTLAKNGTLMSRTEQRNYTPNASSPTTISAELVTDLEPGDALSAYIENVSGTAGVDVESYALTV